MLDTGGACYLSFITSAGMPGKVGSGKTSGFWAAIPSGWAATAPGRKIQCHFPLESSGDEDAVAVCKWSVTGGLAALASHIEVKHAKDHPDIVKAALDSYKGIPLSVSVVFLWRAILACFCLLSI